jgi:hypothetical protein
MTHEERAPVPLAAPLSEPALYDPESHRKHRAGHDQAPSAEQQLRTLLAFPHQERIL